MTTATFSAEYAHILHKSGIVSTEETRYYLTGVCIHKAATRPGCYLVATNGGTLGVFYDPNATTDTHGLIVKLNKDGIRDSKPTRDGTKRVIHVGGSIVSICDVDGTGLADPNKVRNGMAGEVIDGTFPAWQRVIPSHGAMADTPAPHSTYNAALLASFGFRSEGRKGAAVVTVQNGSHSSPAAVLNGDFPNFYGVIMTATREHTPRKADMFPDWLADDPTALPVSEAAE